MAKRQFSVIVFFENQAPKKWRNVTNLYSFSQYLDKMHRGWQYMNVYSRETRSYLKRYYSGGYIPVTI